MENDIEICPCCSGKSYISCCGRFIDNDQAPATPEELMRSRYTAYATNNMLYIERTMKSPAADRFNKNSKPPNLTWLKLEVLNASACGNDGNVEYIAHYYDNGRLLTLHEKSKFRLDEGRWYYVDGEIVDNLPSRKVGRNSLCLCGSGKKYKKCCLNKHS